VRFRLNHKQQGGDGSEPLVDKKHQRAVQLEEQFGIVGREQHYGTFLISLVACFASNASGSNGPRHSMNSS
jgi:hypothetical protein